MKYFITLISCLALVFNLSAQSGVQKYDSVLAKKLGADDYGMKSYVLAILKTGTNNLEKGKVRDSLFRGHMKNISRLANLGKLVIAGPLGDNEKSYQGIFVLNVSSIAEAEDLLQTDPVIYNKVLDAELYQWYGSAAISEYLKIQDKITRKHY